MEESTKNNDAPSSTLLTILVILVLYLCVLTILTHEDTMNLMGYDSSNRFFTAVCIMLIIEVVVMLVLWLLDFLHPFRWLFGANLALALSIYFLMRPGMSKHVFYGIGGDIIIFIVISLILWNKGSPFKERV